MTTVAGNMEIVVRGRNVVIPDHYRQHVEEKLAKLERYDHKIHRADVELQHEKNPRQNGSCQHVEITLRTRGPVVRSEGCSDDFYAALDMAADRLERRLRHAADRRRVHHGRRRPESVGEATAALADTADGADLESGSVDAGDDVDSAQGPGRVVREKEHPAEPMNVDQALLRMELVGHDFYLFKCAETGKPTVVYRRHAYDYGLIRLGEDVPAEPAID